MKKPITRTFAALDETAMRSRASIVFDADTDISKLFYPDALAHFAEYTETTGELPPFIQDFHTERWGEHWASPELSLVQIDGEYMIKVHTD